MKKLLPVAQLIYSSWIVSDDQPGEIQSIPTTSGVLDHALRDVVAHSVLPTWVSSSLHFVETNAGLACLELPQIQKIATEARLTSDPNPSYTRTEIEVSPLVARRCLSRLGISEEQAKSIGLALREAATKAERELGFAAA
jgi:hypothetical protein